jgi:DNA-binding GntR family transcriptional regulator
LDLEQSLILKKIFKLKIMGTYAPLINIINANVQHELFGKPPSIQVNFIYDNLKTFIAQGLLPVHSKLNIQVLKKEYSVSTGVIQTAIANLIDSRYAYKVSKGVFISDLSMNELREILNLRLILEKNAIKVAFKNGDDEWECNIIRICHSISKLENKILSDGTENYLQLLKNWSILNNDFHLRLFLTSNLDISVSLIDTLYKQCDKYFLSGLLSYEISLSDISGHHVDLKNAVLARNVEEAGLILSSHVKKISNNFENFLHARSLN